MASKTIAHLTGAEDLDITSSGKVPSTASLKQSKTYAEAVLLYTDSLNLPKSLSKNTLLFTTDTRELFIGTGQGIKRVNIGSDGTVIDKTDYLTKEEAQTLLVFREELDPDNVVLNSKFLPIIGSIQDQIDDLVNAYKDDYVSPKCYTKDEADATFVSKTESEKALSMKVDINKNTAYGTAHVLNDGTLLGMKYVDNTRQTTDSIMLRKCVLEIGVTNALNKGSRLILSGSKAYYTKTATDYSYTDDDELLTQLDALALRDEISVVEGTAEDAKSTAQAARSAATEAKTLALEAQQNAEVAYNSSVNAYSAATAASQQAQLVEDKFNNAMVNMLQAQKDADKALEKVEALKDELDRLLEEFDRYQGKTDVDILDLKATIRALDRKVTAIENSVDIVVDPNDIDTNISVSDAFVIAKVPSFEGIKVPERTTFNMLDLPSIGVFTLDTGFTRRLQIDWNRSDYSMTVFDVPQTIYGTPALPDDGSVVNTNNLKVQIEVTVESEEEKEEILTLTSVDMLAGYTVVEGTTFNAIGLPITIGVTLSDGTTSSLPVTWDSTMFDPTYVGAERRQNIDGVISLPSNVLNPKGLKATVTVTITEKEQPDLEVLSVNPLESITVDAGETITWPSLVTVKLSDSTERTLYVRWSTIDLIDDRLDIPQTVTGTLVLEKPVVNPKGITASVVVTIKSIQTEGYTWTKYFVVPETTKVIRDFQNTIGKTFPAEDMYGVEFDGVNERVEIRFIGNVKAKGSALDTIAVYDKLEDVPLYISCLDQWQDGIRMPNDAEAPDVDENETIAKVTNTNPSLACGVWYQYNDETDTLTFVANSQTSQIAYMIRRSNSYLPSIAEGDIAKS